MALRPGPDRAVRLLVCERDEYRCRRCGAAIAGTWASLHHRQSRRFGNHAASNLVLLCGSGSSGCHGWVHEHKRAARLDFGLIVLSAGVPADAPVLDYARGWILLRDDGLYSAVA